MAGRRKPGLTFERHCEIGQELADMQRQLDKLRIEVSRVYPLASQYAKAMATARTSLFEARSKGENQAIRDYPDRWSAQVYFPGPSGDDPS